LDKSGRYFRLLQKSTKVSDKSALLTALSTQEGSCLLAAGAPTNRDNIVLRTEARPIKIKRAAVAIDEAPPSALSGWRFEVFFLPWTKSIVSVRPIPPKDAARKRAKKLPT
jgi:hypothetical protein